MVQEIANLSGLFNIAAVLDDSFSEKKILNGMIYGPVSIYSDFNYDSNQYFIAIGDNYTRERMAERLALPAERYANLFHPSAIISHSAIIGCGIVVMPNSVINAAAKIGNHSIINTGSIIEHDTMISDYVHISPNAVLTGNVQVGSGTHIGASATLIPGVVVGSRSIIGAGSCVIKNIPSNCTAYGVPAHLKKTDKREEI